MRNSRLAGALLLLGRLALVPSSLTWAQAPTAAEKEKIGLTALNNRLRLAAPTGAGVAVTQVESALTPFGTNYLPNASDSQLLSDTIIPKTAGATVSTHATAVGQAWYGSGGVSRGVSTIDAYEAGAWQTNVLRIGTSMAPAVENRDVVNHSWIGNFSTVELAEEALKRIDLVAKRDNVVVVTAMNNGSGTLIPDFPTSLYNGITVGLSSGNSSAGPTIVYPGRSKPDIVVPATTTSIGAAWVSGAAAILKQAAEGNANRGQATTIKAALLAGATKNEFDLTQSTPSTLDDWSHTSTHPLDDRLGAGELNIDNSHRILTSPERSASNVTEAPLTGWDYGQASPANLQQYFFTIPAGRVAETVSIVAAWNRDITFAAPGTLTSSMADIDLVLSKAQGFVSGSPVAASISTVDNVEHVYLRGLTPGQYVMALPTDMLWNYSLAWDIKLALPGDGNADGLVNAADYTIWADNFLKTGAKLWEGDFNGDAKVDAADYTIWADNFSPGAALAAHAAPEPASWILLGIGLLPILFLRRRR